MRLTYLNGLPLPAKVKGGFREAVHIVLTAISTSSALRSKMVMKGGLLMAIRYDSGGVPSAVMTPSGRLLRRSAQPAEDFLH